jgi:hypothetical protein
MDLTDRGSVVVAAEGSDRDASADAVIRPAPHRWLWYALGGGLPRRNSRWVLHDTTTGTWWARHIARSLVQIAVPVALVMVFMPAGWGLRAAAAGGGLALALFYSLAYMPETTENRIVKAGYPAGTATAERERLGLGRAQRESERTRAAAARRAARYRERTGR